MSQSVSWAHVRSTGGKPFFDGVGALGGADCALLHPPSSKPQVIRTSPIHRLIRFIRSPLRGPARLLAYAAARYFAFAVELDFQEFAVRVGLLFCFDGTVMIIVKIP